MKLRILPALGMAAGSARVPSWTTGRNSVGTCSRGGTSGSHYKHRGTSFTNGSRTATAEQDDLDRRQESPSPTGNATHPSINRFSDSRTTPKEAHMPMYRDEPPVLTPRPPSSIVVWAAPVRDLNWVSAVIGKG